MIFSINKTERALLDIISSEAKKLDTQAYIVGGYVRDRLLGRPCKDMDIVCLGSGINLAENVAAQLFPRPKVVVFQRFGTAMFRYQDLEVEFVGARKESYRADSRKPSVEDGTLEDDQNRRDFTINALAVSLAEETYGQIIDPFNGILHLEEKILKTPLEPGRTFSDDPLRMMRGIRFATQLNFTIEPVTLQAISLYKNRIKIVSAERITTELEKILATPVPSVGFKLLMDTGLLEIIFPEMYALKGVEYVNGKGHKDNFYHTLQVLDNLCKNSNNIWLRWAAVLHDIAKPPTKKYSPEVGWTFHGHEVVGADMTARIFRKLRLPLDHKLRFVQKMVLLHLRPISLTKNEVSDSAVRRLLFEAGEDIDDLMMLCEADITSKNAQKVKAYLEGYELVREKLIEIEEKDRLRNWQPPITGEIIMQTFGLMPSNEVGILKNVIREAILEGQIPNEYAAAYNLMLSQATAMNISVKDDSFAPK